MTNTLPVPARRAVKSMSRTAGRLSSARRVDPDFLIVGAQRCGTTSMYKTLSQHPAVVPAVLRKGVHYFDTDYQRGRAWYRAHFPLASTMRRAARSTGEKARTGESSPYYMFHPLSGQRIASDLPGVKLLVLLRDPVERAYSAHAHELARGFETEPFARAVELEDARTAGERERLLEDPTYESHHWQHNAYLARGRYVEQLRALADALGDSARLHVVDSGDFFDEPETVMGGILDHLGLSRWDGFVFDRHNARPRSTMDPALRAELTSSFDAWDAELATWLGRTPSWRR